jgi:HK97 family phage portal protein
MGILSRMIRPKAAMGGNPYIEQMLTSIYGGMSSSSGVSVNSDSAMRQMTVYACVKILSQSIAQMPCHLMEDYNGLKNKANNHNIYRILHDQPNVWQTAPEFWGMAVAHISLRGDFIAFKPSTGGKIQSLLPISPGRIREIKQNTDYSLTYKIASNDGDIKEFPQDQIFHIRGLTLDGISGVNPIEHARESIGMALASEKFLSKWFGKGMHPGAILKHPLTLSAQAHSNIKKNFKEKYAGLGNSHDFMVLDEGMGIEFPPIKLVDAQFLELNKLTQAQIAGIFRVPLMLLQAGDNPTTFASAEQFMLAFVTHALTPIVVNIEKAIYRDLLTKEEQSRYYAKFSMAGLLRGDMATRFAAYQTGINACFLSPNEVRSFEEMNNYEGGDSYETRTSTVKQDNNTKDTGTNPEQNKGSGK